MLDIHKTGGVLVSKQMVSHPREIVVQLIEEADDIKDKEGLFHEFRRRLTRNEDHQRAVEWYFFVNMYEYLVTTRTKKPPRQNSERRTEAEQQVQSLKEQIKNIVLLDLVLPGGKKLRDATFAECEQAGGWLAKVAKKGKSNQVVGKTLTEKQLRAIK